MDDNVLIVNAGSSSLKVRLLDHDDQLRGSWDDVPDELPDVNVVAHRVVHGGAQFRDAIVIDREVLESLRALTPLAPLHQPKSLDAYEEFAKLLPNATHVACFDTAFHTTIPAPAATYAIPREWNDLYQIRRYGFHGLSHAWASRLAREFAPDARRVITCHLGAGLRCARSSTVSRSTPQWVSPLSKAW